MPMNRTPSRHGRAWSLPSHRSSRLAPGLLLALLAGSVALSGCQKDDDDLLRPDEVVSNVLVATYISPEDFAGNEIKMDGEAKDQEWGGPLDAVRRYTQVRLSDEFGAGSPGEPVYASIKAVYTEKDLFLLVRWADPEANDIKAMSIYTGPDLTNRRGCQPALMADENWLLLEPEEDRLVFAWEIEPASDAAGLFRDDGCLVACHPGASPAFGRVESGRLDVWQWLAARTNPLRRTYEDIDDPNFPKYGTPGYLDDYVIDPVAGLVPDPGRSPYLPNLQPGSARPLWVYRPSDDRFANPMDPSNCENAFGERCRVNNGLPVFYIWRDDLERLPFRISECDTLNYTYINVLETRPGSEPRPWKRGDVVSAYYYTYPTESRDDVRGRAVYSEGFWTLEMARPLNTGDPANDVIFRGEPGERVTFTLSIADHSATTHWGSGPQILEFGPKTSKTRPGSRDGRSGE